MFRSLNISKVQKSSLTNSTDFDFLMKSMHREKDKEKENVGAFNWIEQKKKKKITHSLIEKNGASGDYDSIIGKINTFVEITLKLLSQQHHSQTLIKQARSLGEYLQSKLPTLNFNPSDAQVKLLQLQKQNQQLQQLIHSHELTNIRMHIRINDQQSNDIQTYKRKLQQSYASYKKLQEKVAGYKAKISQLSHKVHILTIESSKSTKTVHYLESLLKKKSQQLQCHTFDETTVEQLQSVIDDQNNQLQKMCLCLKETISKHEEKQCLWSDEVIQYKNRIRQLEKRVGEKEMRSKQIIMDWKDGQDELWRCVFVQAGVIEKLL